MKRLMSLFALALILAFNISFSAPAAAAAPHPSAAPITSAAGKPIPNHYIVVLKDGTDPRAVAAISGAKPTHVYRTALNGFAAELNQGQLNALQHHPGVAYIEQDQEVQLDATQVMDASLARPADSRTSVTTGSTSTWRRSGSASCARP